MVKLVFYWISVAVLIRLSIQSLQEDILKEINNTEDVLSRRRRYLVFPSGSSLQLVYCLTVPSLGVGNIFTLGSTIALAWELPDDPEILLEKKFKKDDAPETTTLPPLMHHDHDHSEYDDYVEEKIDNSHKYSQSSWKLQSNKYSGIINSIKSYYNPFRINQSPAFGYSTINRAPSKPDYKTLPKNVYSHYNRNGFTSRGSNRKISTNYASNRKGSGNGKNIYRAAYHNRPTTRIEPVTTYLNPADQYLHRRTRRDLYEKLETFFTALNQDGKACLMKAICEVSQVDAGKGTFMQEIIKVVFRIKPYEDHPDEDEYDAAYNKTHNCTEQYPTCNGSIWNGMLNN